MEKYPTRNELLNYVVRIRPARTLEFMKVDALLKKYPEIYSRIALEYKDLKRYTHYDIDIKMVNSMVNKKKSIEFINQKLDTTYSKEFKKIVRVVKSYKALQA